MSACPAPLLSVVIAASDSPDAVARTLASLAEAGRGPIEIVVATALGSVLDRAVLPAGVTWIASDPETPVPRLRRLGLDHARGAVVVFTEDSCLFAPGWADSWHNAFVSDRVLAATGDVEPALGNSLTDWAVFFFEYAPFVARRTRDSSPPRRLAGNDFAVRRQLISDLDPETIEESDIPRLATRRGGVLARAEGAVAFHVRGFRLAGALLDRFRLGRAYGRHRAATRSRAGRAAGLLAGPAIWVTQVARLSITVVRSRRFLDRFAASFPLILALVTAWSAGEWLGWALMALPAPACCKRRGRAAPPPGQAAGRARA